ncbi:MAG: tRNA pseudouridine(13) synthase TruD, partial [Candidatus Micrarchaeota archaeon]
MELSYLSKSLGIGGALKAAPQDFLVEEIAPDGAIYELGRKYDFPDEPGGYTKFILQKKNWTTASAVSEIAKKINADERAFNIAGSKDKISVSTQAVTVKGDRKHALAALSIRDISINGAWLVKERLRLGGLLGNRFTIRVRDCTAS